MTIIAKVRASMGIAWAHEVLKSNSRPILYGSYSYIQSRSDRRSCQRPGMPLAIGTLHKCSTDRRNVARFANIRCRQGVGASEPEVSQTTNIPASSVLM
jgi:hypothetical protein